ncbi:MAG: hypothetical protein ACLPY1_18815 [Terracidiphilus sp.]
MPLPVEKNVDYLPQDLEQIPFSPLASSGSFLICDLNPYLSTTILPAAESSQHPPRASLDVLDFTAFHNRS